MRLPDGTTMTLDRQFLVKPRITKAGNRTLGEALIAAFGLADTGHVLKPSAI